MYISLLSKAPGPSGGRIAAEALGDDACRSPKSLLGLHRKLVVGHLAKDHIADQSFSRVQCAAVTAREAAQCIFDLWLPTEGPGQQISTPSSIRLRPCGHAVSQGVTTAGPPDRNPSYGGTQDTRRVRPDWRRIDVAIGMVHLDAGNGSGVW